MTVQSILFDKKKWTCNKARIWMTKHKHKPIKRVDKTYSKNFLRYRLQDPKKFKNFSSKKLPNGVQLVFGWNKSRKSRKSRKSKKK